MEPEHPFSIVCLSSQEWRSALPTNRQQIMSRAAERGHSVLFVETGGWLGRHLWRLLRGPRRGSLVRRLTFGEEAGNGVQVAKLWTIIPLAQRYELANRVNWRLGSWTLRVAVRKLPGPRILWIYDPRAVDALGTFEETFAVYDCVDDYPEQARYDERSYALVAAADRLAGRQARLVFATTQPLLERHRQANANTHLVPNVGDFEHFAVASDRSYAEPELLALPRPVLGFFGNIEPSKIQFGILRSLSDAFPDGTVLVVGPARGDGRQQIEQLATAANVRWLGFRDYVDLPRVLAAFDVALIPYAENDYTRSCFPLKLFEYLSAGKPVVATGLPALAGLEPHVVVADGADGAIAAVRAALDRRENGKEERIAFAAQNTWDTRTTRLLSLVETELSK
ncbi:MAG: glycosyltransferase [Actinomycetota bacterium]